MKPTVKRLLDALRSGQYQQTTGRLRTPSAYPAFCVLGVACDVARKEGVTDDDFEGKKCLMPESVKNYFGFCTNSGDFLPTEAESRKIPYSALVQLNDFLGMNFNQLADLIEDNPKGLFCDEEENVGLRRAD